MPLYCFATDGSEKCERVFLSFPKGTDAQSAMEYVKFHYGGNPRFIRLAESTTNEVTEIIVQRKPVKIQAEREDVDTESDGEAVEMEDDSEIEIAGGEHDPNAPR